MEAAWKKTIEKPFEKNFNAQDVVPGDVGDLEVLGNLEGLKVS